MPANQSSITNYVWSILTLQQKQQVAAFAMLGATPFAKSLIGSTRTKTATRSTARTTATRTRAKKTTTRTRTAKASGTKQDLIDYFATHPGGWSAADLAAKTNIKPRVIGRVLNAKNSPFRKNGDLWLMNSGTKVSRKLTAGTLRAAA